jgi:hypothetical protein
VSSLTDTVPPEPTTAEVTPPTRTIVPEPKAEPKAEPQGRPDAPLEPRADVSSKPARRERAGSKASPPRKLPEDRARGRARRPEAPETDVPAGQAALAAVRVVLATAGDRRFLDRIVRLKNPPEEPAEAAVAVAFAVLGLSSDTRAALTSLRTLHSADPVTIGVNLGRATHAHLAEMHRVAAALLDVEPSALPGDDRAIPAVARDLVDLTDAALSRATVLERIRA